MIKVYDCSNSNEYVHTGVGGPRMNDVMASLRSYFDFVNNVSDAEVVITNDIFPSYIPEDIPKVKRMDGRFWLQKDFRRNKPLEDAAKKADTIVFVSYYSKNQHKLFIHKPEDKLFTALNCANPLIFKRKKERSKKPRVWIAVASDWSREVKRMSEVQEFSRHVDKLIVVGRNWENPICSRNIEELGYIEDYAELTKILSSCDGFVNLSYRDAAPKVVSQAVCVGLPIIYADSGGTREMAKGASIALQDGAESEYKEIPELEGKVYVAIEAAENNWEYLSDTAFHYDAYLEHHRMCLEYWKAIKASMKKK